jgi:hypothetical protein
MSSVGHRIRRACQPCAKRKLKCDERRPCARCVENNCSHLCVDRIYKREMVKAVDAIPIDTSHVFIGGNVSGFFAADSRTSVMICDLFGSPNSFSSSSSSSSFSIPVRGAGDEVNVKQESSVALTELGIPLLKHISSNQNYIRNGPARLFSFEKHWNYMSSVADNLSPFSWEEFLLRSPLWKLKAFLQLASLYLSWAGAQEFISKCFLNYVSPYISLESSARIQKRLAAVFDHPVGLASRLGRDECLPGASEMQLNLPQIPVRAQMLGWSEPALYICKFDHDEKRNSVCWTAGFNLEAERLWGYSTTELKESAQLRREFNRKLQIPFTGCKLAMETNK